MNWLESKYVSLLSFRLRNFKRKGTNGYNFSCPICLDSAKNKSKARAYIYDKKGIGMFHCHNCSAHMSVPKFIKALDPNLYNEFNLERLKDSTPQDATQFALKMKRPIFRKEGILANLKTVSQLSPNDPVKQLVVNRKIPNKLHSLLFKCDNFMKFTNELLPNKFSADALKYDGTRLLIPFFNQAKNCFAYQGRAIDDNHIRYIMIVVDETEPKVYGLERLDPNKKTYVFEGPIDSMFIDNAISTAGGDMVATLANLHIEKENLIICYDNEKYSKETVKKINKAIEHNYKVLIYPDTFAFKDINEAILGGMNSSDLHFILERNTFVDLSARLRLNTYKKV